MDIQRTSKEKLQILRLIGSATASAELRNLGLRDSHISGISSITPSKAIAGNAVTLQFMPRREDQYPDGNEYLDPESQLHRHVLYEAQEGDVVVVDARSDMSSGIFGEMMLSYLKGKKGAGVVIDGCIRDSAYAKELGLGIWVRGTTPNWHAQTNIFPFGVNVPVACGNRLVFPGDVIIADDDGAVVVPSAYVDPLIEAGTTHAEWEEFSRGRLLEGGDLRKYYPLRSDAIQEYEEWKKEKG